MGGKAETGRVRSTGASLADWDVEQRFVCEIEDNYIYIAILQA